METISKRFEELDVCGKFTLKTKLWEIAYPDQNSMCPPPAKVNTKGASKKPMNRNPRSTKHNPSYWECVDAFHLCKIAILHHLLSSPIQERSCLCWINFSHLSTTSFITLLMSKLMETVDIEDYIKLFGGTNRFVELRMSLLVDGLTKVTMDKWMDITDMVYVIASRYNVILVSLSQQQSITFFPLRSQPLADSSVHRIICIGHIYGNHFVQVYLKDCCPLPPLALLWSSNCHPQAK
ncbi:hypothetical protein GmHk_15G044912 [Glycine max]|nr:hypothetical protein GmHk_15G044912 [Glycine max]